MLFQVVPVVNPPDVLVISFPDLTPRIQIPTSIQKFCGTDDGSTT